MLVCTFVIRLTALCVRLCARRGLTLSRSDMRKCHMGAAWPWLSALSVVNGSTRTPRLLLDGFDPLLLLLRRGSRYPVHYMVALNDSPVRLRLAGLDHLTFVVGVVELEAVLKERRDRILISELKCKMFCARMQNRLERILRDKTVAGVAPYRFPGLVHLSDTEVLQRNNPARLFILQHTKTTLSIHTSLFIST